MKHLMLDLETMGTKPGCAIISIGAVQFDLDKGIIGQKFYTGCSLHSNQLAGLTIEADTVLWWIQQNERSRRKLIEGPNTSLDDALVTLANFIKAYGITIVWGNSSSFDCSILAEAYNVLGMNIPWLHWNEKCYRTIIKLFPVNYPKKDESKAHDPIYDCEYQIGKLLATMKTLKGKVYV